MGKVDYRTLTKSQREENRAILLKTFAGFGLTRDGQEFLEDLLTESEITMLARRLLIAKKLLAGEEIGSIARDLHVGSLTVRSIDTWLEQKFDAYRTVLPPLLQKEKPREGKTRRHRIPLDPYSFRGMRKRYPSNFALLNCLLGEPDLFEED
jgi:uncharacterized protein YerC